MHNAMKVFQFIININGIKMAVGRILKIYVLDVKIIRARELLHT